MLSCSQRFPQRKATGRKPTLRLDRRRFGRMAQHISRKYNTCLHRIQDLFNRIGPVLKLSLTYDRAGRSEGIAYVTYESPQDAKKAIREFDGANAKGRITIFECLNQSDSSRSTYPLNFHPLGSFSRPPKPIRLCRCSSFIGRPYHACTESSISISIPNPALRRQWSTSNQRRSLCTGQEQPVTQSYAAPKRR